MTKIKIKLEPARKRHCPGVLVYQIIHRKDVKQIQTNYLIYPEEWNESLSQVVMPEADKKRKGYLMGIKCSITKDFVRLRKIVRDKERNCCHYSAGDIVSQFVNDKMQSSLFEFIEAVIADLRGCGKMRLAEAYSTTRNSFRRFCKNSDIELELIDSELIVSYETYLRNCGLCPNSSSFYLRNLRAVYNRAVDRGLTIQRYPFKYVYTGVDRTVKRAVSVKVIKQIMALNLSKKPFMDFAKDMFMFSFYTRGMSFVDMAYLRKKDLKDGILSYRRCKTGQLLCIKWESCMQELVNKYNVSQSPYLLPIINPANIWIEERMQYVYALHRVNYGLRKIGCRLGLALPLTMYVARHTWASIAHSKNIPLSVISESLGHDSESTTRIYLASLDNMVIDNANRVILKLLQD